MSTGVRKQFLWSLNPRLVCTRFNKSHRFIFHQFIILIHSTTTTIAIYDIRIILFKIIFITGYIANIDTKLDIISIGSLKLVLVLRLVIVISWSWSVLLIMDVGFSMGLGVAVGSLGSFYCCVVEFLVIFWGGGRG
jgi:hypothetical protein